jgi:hypothetical protein
MTQYKALICIKEHNEETLIVETPTHHYQAVHDTRGLSDWNVHCDEDPSLSQGVWIKTKDGVVQFILEHIGLIEDGEYERNGDPYT